MGIFGNELTLSSTDLKSKVIPGTPVGYIAYVEFTYRKTEYELIYFRGVSSTSLTKFLNRLNSGREVSILNNNLEISISNFDIEEMGKTYSFWTYQIAEYLIGKAIIERVF